MFEKPLLYLGCRQTRNPEYYIAQFYDADQGRTAGVLLRSDVPHPDEMMDVVLRVDVQLTQSGLSARAVDIVF